MRGKGALVALLASPSAGYTAQQPRPRARRRPTELAATTLDAKAVKGAPLDIGVEEPARSIDVYTTLPPVDIRLLDEQEHDDLPGRTHVINLAKGPPCPDPFALVKSELIPFSDNMKLLVASENPILSQAASHFFEKRHGKRFRPTIVMLLAQALPNSHKDSDDVVFERQTRLGQVT